MEQEGNRRCRRYRRETTGRWRRRGNGEVEEAVEEEGQREVEEAGAVNRTLRGQRRQYSRMRPSTAVTAASRRSFAASCTLSFIRPRPFSAVLVFGLVPRALCSGRVLTDSSSPSFLLSFLFSSIRFSFVSHSLLVCMCGGGGSMSFYLLFVRLYV